MGWKSVVCAGWLVPVLAGCGSLRHAHNATTEVLVAHAQHAIERDLRRDARESWRAVRGEHPRRAFTDEFRDGFLDGYTDYLDRGGAAQPPAVPPIKYVRCKRYFTPEGQCLIRDYYLGFKYGTDCAIASGRRQFLTVPVLLSDCTPGAAVEPVTVGPLAPTIPFVPSAPPGTKPMPAPNPLPPPRPVTSDTATGPSGGNKFGNKFGSDPLKPAPDVPPVASLPVASDVPPKAIPPLPKPELPVIKPFNPVLPGDTKFTPLPVPPDPDRLPAPNPPLPIPLPSPLLVPPDPINVPLPSPNLTLPPPPDAVPTLPPTVPTPSVLDDLPVIPFRFVTPPVTPAAALLPVK